MVNHNRISKLVIGYGITVCVGFALSVAVAMSAINTLRINGQLFQQIADSKDFVADILPPPLYVVEAYSNVELLERHPERLADIKKALNALHQDYETSETFWLASRLDSPIRQQIQAELSPTTRAFWTEVERKVIPAIEHNDRAELAQEMAETDRLYTAQRQIVDSLMEKANSGSLEIQKTATKETKLYLWLVASVFAAILTIMVAGLVFIWRTLGRYARASGASRKALQELAMTFEANVAGVVQVVAGSAHALESTAVEMAQTASRASEATTSVAAAADQATANVSIVASSTDEMGKSVNEIALQMNQSTLIAAEAVARASSTSATITALSLSADRIGSVVRLISDIAAQTNLLALNATI